MKQLPLLVTLTPDAPPAGFEGRFRLVHLVEPAEHLDPTAACEAALGLQLPPVVVLLGGRVAAAFGAPHLPAEAWIDCRGSVLSVLPDEDPDGARRLLREALDQQAAHDHAAEQDRTGRPLRQALARNDHEAALLALEPLCRGSIRGLRASGLDQDDLLQAARAGCWRALTTYRGDRRNLRNVLGWCGLLARRSAVDLVRSARRRQPDSDHIELDGVDERFAHTGPGPAQLAETRDELRTVVSTLGGLPSRDSVAMRLTAVHGMTQAEAGQAVGVAAKTINVAVWRARRALREARDAA